MVEPETGGQYVRPLENFDFWTFPLKPMNVKIQLTTWKSDLQRALDGCSGPFSVDRCYKDILFPKVSARSQQLFEVESPSGYR